MLIIRLDGLFWMNRASALKRKIWQHLPIGKCNCQHRWEIASRWAWVELCVKQTLVYMYNKIYSYIYYIYMGIFMYIIYDMVARGKCHFCSWRYFTFYQRISFTSKKTLKDCSDIYVTYIYALVFCTIKLLDQLSWPDECSQPPPPSVKTKLPPTVSVYCLLFPLTFCFKL